MIKPLSLILLCAGFVSCQSPSLTTAEKIRLSSTAMTLTQRGAEVGECSLVGQFERGRSSSTNAGGSGCSACAQ